MFARRREPKEWLDFLRGMTGAPDTPMWVLLAWLCGSLTVNTLPDILGLPGVIGLNVLGIGAFSLFWWRRRRQGQNLELEMRFAPERRPPKVPGLILPVSTLSVRGTSEEEKKTVEALLKAPAEGFVPLSQADLRLLERSNLMPAMAALEYHYTPDTPSSGKEKAEGLQQCWLIATEDVPRSGKEEIERGSQEAARLLERCFFTRHPKARDRVVFHRDEYRGLRLTVHPSDYTGMADVVAKIFRKSPYKPESVLAEITPGNKLMTLAVALACLPPKRAMQYMASDRDPVTGEPLTASQFRPVLIDIDAYVSQSEEE